MMVQNCLEFDAVLLPGLFWIVRHGCWKNVDDHTCVRVLGFGFVVCQSGGFLRGFLSRWRSSSK